MSQDNFDPLAGFSAGAEPSINASARAFSDAVVRNPVPAALGAAAVGAGLMALLALLARGESAPLTKTIPLAPPRGLDLEGLKQTIADLGERLAGAVPATAAKERVDAATDALADGWGSVRQQALDAVGALGRFEPQAKVALQVARENPVWTALVVGAVGALVGSQLIGRPAATDGANPERD